MKYKNYVRLVTKVQAWWRGTWFRRKKEKRLRIRHAWRARRDETYVMYQDRLYTMQDAAYHMKRTETVCYDLDKLLTCPTATLPLKIASHRESTFFFEKQNRVMPL